MLLEGDDHDTAFFWTFDVIELGIVIRESGMAVISGIVCKLSLFEMQMASG